MRAALRALALAAGLAACQPGEAPADVQNCAGDDCAPRAGQPAGAPVAAHAAARAAFDYWILALSWSPEYCASTEARPDSRQCRQAREFIVHGLWPQYERGHPEFCDTRTRISEHSADRLGELVPDRGLVFHQWKKHGSCSGLAADDYFATLERAGRSIAVPRDALERAAARPMTRIALERAFIDANPALSPAAITLHCRSGYLREVRVCLDHTLRPRACGADIDEACGRELRVRPARS